MQIDENLILWVKILFRDQILCVIDRGSTTKYFWLGRGSHQGDSISALLLILDLEISFLLMKSKPRIEGLTIFNYN